MTSSILSASLLQPASNTELMQPGAAASGNSASVPAPFAGLLHEAVSNLNQLEDTASKTVEGLMRGDGTDVHAAMIATQKADLAFEGALAVRNKAVSAYQTMMGLQF